MSRLPPDSWGSKPLAHRAAELLARRAELAEQEAELGAEALELEVRLLESRWDNVMLTWASGLSRVSVVRYGHDCTDAERAEAQARFHSVHTLAESLERDLAVFREKFRDALGSEPISSAKFPTNEELKVMRESTDVNIAWHHRGKALIDAFSIVNLAGKFKDSPDASRSLLRRSIADVWCESLTDTGSATR